MSGRALKGAVGMLSLALLAGTGLVRPAGADESDRSKVDGRTTYYVTESEGRPFEPYTELPTELNTGAPSTDTELQMAPAPVHCEAISAFFDPGAVPDALAGLFTEGKYQNPQKPYAKNPGGTYPTKASVGQAPGPYASAECPSDTNAVATASFGRYVSDQFSVESASSDSTQQRVEADNVIVSETTNKLQGLKVGALSISSVLSWLKVEFRPGVDPKVSYRLELSGIHNGDQPAGALGDQGVAFSGQNVGGNDWVKQFNDQMDKNKDALKTLFTYGLRVLQPTFTRNQRSSADRGGSVYPYYYQLAAIDGVLEPTARQNQTGHGFGFRLGTSRVGGNWDFYSE